MVLGVECGDADLVHNGLVAATAVRGKEFNVTGSTVALAIMFMVAIWIVSHDLVTMLTGEVLWMPGLAQCGETFLQEIEKSDVSKCKQQ